MTFFFAFPAISYLFYYLGTNLEECLSFYLINLDFLISCYKNDPPLGFMSWFYPFLQRILAWEALKFSFLMDGSDFSKKGFLRVLLTWLP